MGATRTGHCECCGQTFTVPRRPGPVPRYCSHAHRQRAYKIRRAAGQPSRENELVDEVSKLRARSRRLEYDNTRLREELAGATAELNRLDRELYPPTAGLAHLTTPTTPTTPDHPTPQQTPTRKHRWTRTTNT